ncbi:MAG: peptidoglycan DD-metalloendopeptidase family protein [Acidimicrobiales bacterium]
MTHPTLIRWCAALVVTLAFAAAVPPAASDDDPKSIADAKEERDEARERQLEAAMNLSIVDAADVEVVEALEAATELVNLQQAKVDASEQRLAAVRDARRQAEIDLEQTGAAIVDLRHRARDYAVESYVGLADSRAEAWFDASDATVAAHKVALLDTIGTDTADVVDQLRALEETRGDLLIDAERAQIEADEIAADLAVDLGELEERRNRQVQLKAELDRRRTEWEAALETAEQEEADLEAFIKAEEERVARELERARAAAAAAAASSSGASSVPSAPVGVIDADGWTWPTAGGVASGFGQRLHPILGYYRMHSGLDIGGAQGQPIWAANEGIVIMAGWNGGYGNTVVIQHGDSSVTTLYAHMSGFATSVGDYVTSGQVIGYVGSTGLSTGPHLHFEVRISGSPVDPMPYLP